MDPAGSAATKKPPALTKKIIAAKRLATAGATAATGGPAVAGTGATAGSWLTAECVVVMKNLKWKKHVEGVKAKIIKYGRLDILLEPTEVGGW